MPVVLSALTAALTSVLLVAPGPAPSPRCLVPPVPAPVVDPFRDPGCPWCAGNRGLTYGTAPGTPVRAAAAGTVTYSGVVVDTRYVVVEHADGIRATYGGLQSSSFRVGDVVAAGAVVGHSGPQLHFGLRRGDVYVDPTSMLGRLVERARLVPTDGTGRRPAPPPTLRCGAAGPG